MRLLASRRWVSALLFVVVLVSAPGAQVTAGGLDRRVPAVAPGQLAAGTNAVVRADGDCLRVRDIPALSGRSLTCLPEGAVLNVLEGRQTADGYTWVKVKSGTITGWAAEKYLQPAGTSSTTGACPSVAAPSLALAATATPAAQPVTSSSAGISGDVPRQGGVGLVVWKGGAAEAIATAASAGGCQLSAVWATSAEGALLVFVYGAPAVVNAAWLAEFTGGVPQGTAVLLVCGTPTASALRSNPLEATADEASTTVELPLTAVPAVGARTAVVIDGATGTVLHQKEAHLALPPASLTKIVVAILAIEEGDLDAWVKVDVDSRQMAGSSLMGLLPGDCFRLRDLVYGLMLPSGNDAALAIGRFLAGSDAVFVEQMNALLARLGLTDSHFVNPHGLDAAGHTASAYDLAMVSRHGMTLPFFAQVVNTPQWTAKGSRNINLPNVNAFLSSYTGADGVKTGFTGGAGRTLVASATRGGKRVYVALLNAPNRDQDAAKLMDWAFQSPN